jgi:hypothetical protein
MSDSTKDKIWSVIGSSELYAAIILILLAVAQQRDLVTYEFYKTWEPFLAGYITFRFGGKAIRKGIAKVVEKRPARIGSPPEYKKEGNQ